MDLDGEQGKFKITGKGPQKRPAVYVSMALTGFERAVLVKYLLQDKENGPS